jgi:ribosome-binding factor A
MSVLLAREVHDPGLGFVTVTRVKVSPDLQQARIYYTLIGDDRAKKDTERALERAKPFLRRQIGSRVRMRRVPELSFEFDRSVEHQDRIERILLDLAEERKAREGGGSDATPEKPEDESDGHS